MNSTQAIDPDTLSTILCRLAPVRGSRGRWLATMLLSILPFGFCGIARAAPIQVTTTEPTSTTECTLKRAVATANNGATSGACEWTGDREIHLEEATYDTNGVLPLVIDPGVAMIIRGPVGTASATIRRDLNDPAHRFFKVKGTLALSKLVLTGGDTTVGGAIKVFPGGDLTLSTCRFLENSAAGWGGAIYNLGTLEVVDSTFDRNSAGSHGGAVYSGDDASASVSSSTFVDNSATGDGGAIAMDRPSDPALGLQIENSTFSSNDAAWGGALAILRGSASVDMTTFKDNTSTTFGSAIAVTQASNTSLTLRRSAIAGCESCSPTIPALCDGPVTSDGNNAAEDSTCGLDDPSDQQNVALYLSDLVDDHGGLTAVHVPRCPWDGVNGDCNSPLIEQYECCGLGESGACLGQEVPRDQRDQFPRKDLSSGSVGNGGEYCDIGAYESICSEVHNYGALQRVNLHGYQVSGASVLLDNGGCYSHTLSFEATEGCRVEWSIDTWLKVSDVILIDDACPVDCFADPAECASQCSLPDPTGWIESNPSGGDYGFDIPSCDIEEPFRYVVEYFRTSDPNTPAIKLYWDPRNPIQQCTGPSCG